MHDHLHVHHTANFLFFSDNIAMRYKDVKKLADDKFRRLTGIKYLNFKPFFMLDKGYLGIEQLGFGCLMPFKAKKGEKLAPELKDLNKEISRRRIGIEHVFGRMKFFKILSCVYRNRRKRMNLRFNLLAGIYNLEWAKD